MITNREDARKKNDSIFRFSIIMHFHLFLVTLRLLFPSLALAFIRRPRKNVLKEKRALADCRDGI